MNIIDDYLSEDMFKELYKVYTGSNRQICWAYHNQANPASNDIDNFQFINLLYDYRFDKMKVDVATLALLQHLPNGFKSVIRSKANLFTIRDKQIKYGMHQDLIIENVFDTPHYNIKTLLYYINSNNGGTEFEIDDNIKFVQSKANRAVIVDYSVKHQ